MPSLTAELGRAVNNAHRSIVRASWRLGRGMRVPHRNDFPYLLNYFGLAGEGVEVGTCRGTYAHRLLSGWHGKMLHCVDPWRDFTAESNYVDRDNVTQAEQDQRYAETQRRLARFRGRHHLHRLTSLEGSTLFGNRELDFVYIDAQHHYEAVCEDLACWSPKVRPGGFLAGHDYLDQLRVEGQYGVKCAVDEWAAERGLPVWISEEPDFPSWFIHLPG
jgi:hypothetical protein